MVTLLSFNDVAAQIGRIYGKVMTITGDEFEAFIVYKDTGSEATSTLIAYFDTVTNGLPFTPSGADVVIQWDDETNRILRLGQLVGNNSSW